MDVNFVYIGLLIGCCAYALLRGGAPERFGAVIFASGTGLTLAMVSAPSSRFHTVEVGILAVDVLGLLALLALALRANRLWPLWVSALHAVAVVGHAAKLASPGVIPWAYAFVLSIWMYPMLLLLCIGTYRHQQRLKRNGVDKSWTSFSLLSRGKRPPPGPPA